MSQGLPGFSGSPGKAGGPVSIKQATASIARVHRSTLQGIKGEIGLNGIPGPPGRKVLTGVSSHPCPALKHLII